MTWYGCEKENETNSNQTFDLRDYFNLPFDTFKAQKSSLSHKFKIDTNRMGKSQPCALLFTISAWSTVLV